MVYTNNNIPMTAGANLLAGVLLAISGDEIVTEAGATANVLGIAYSDVLSGEKVAVVTGVEVNLTASAAITAGARLKSVAGGKVATFVEGTDAENLAFGRALSSAAQDDDIIRAYIM